VAGNSHRWWRLGLMARVTVVTAAYNAAPYIAQSIESVLAQTYKDFDYIVVDDGSSDETATSHTLCPSGHRDSSGECRRGRCQERGVELAAGDYVAR